MNPDSKLKVVYDLRWAWVQELQDRGQIQATKVRLHTDYNIANILTKCHSCAVFNLHIGLASFKAESRSRQVHCGGA